MADELHEKGLTAIDGVHHQRQARPVAHRPGETPQDWRRGIADPDGGRHHDWPEHRGRRLADLAHGPAPDSRGSQGPGSQQGWREPGQDPDHPVGRRAGGPVRGSAEEQPDGGHHCAADPGTIYTNSKAKVAEHGGFSTDDTHVALLVVNGTSEREDDGSRARVVSSPVFTRQIAPTILQFLGLNPEALESVRIEETATLPR